VDKVGPEVRNLRPGQRVVASFLVSCGNCRYCKEKLTSFCNNTNNSSLQPKLYGQSDAGIYGYSHFTGGFPGGQAEYVRVPKGELNLLPIPDSVSDERALYLSDILPTSYHAVVDTGVSQGDVVGIWGLGPIGICAAKWATLKGASRVIGIDAVPERLALAKDKVGIETINLSEHKDVTKRVYELVPEGLDVAIDCTSGFREPKSWTHKIQRTLMMETDSPEILNQMLICVRKMGRCGVIGDYAGMANGVNLGALMMKGIRLIGNGQCPVQRYWEEILEDYIMTGKFDPTMIVTHRVPLEDMTKLYQAFDKRQSGVEKVFVETQFSSPPAPGCPQTTRVDEWTSVN